MMKIMDCLDIISSFYVFVFCFFIAFLSGEGAFILVESVSSGILYGVKYVFFEGHPSHIKVDKTPASLFSRFINVVRAICAILTLLLTYILTQDSVKEILSIIVK